MWAVALFAYALVEKDRIDWAEHTASINGVPPDPQQTAECFKRKPESSFKNIEDQAEKWFFGFARSLLKDYVDEQKRAAIAETVGNQGKFWPAFWNGNLVGVTSNILFTILVVIFVLFISSDFSFIAWSKKIFGLH